MIDRLQALQGSRGPARDSANNREPEIDIAVPRHGRERLQAVFGGAVALVSVHAHIELLVGPVGSIGRLLPGDVAFKDVDCQVRITYKGSGDVFLDAVTRDSLVAEKRHVASVSARRDRGSLTIDG